MELLDTEVKPGLYPTSNPNCVEWIDDLGRPAHFYNGITSNELTGSLSSVLLLTIKPDVEQEAWDQLSYFDADTEWVPNKNPKRIHKTTQALLKELCDTIIDSGNYSSVALIDAHIPYDDGPLYMLEVLQKEPGQHNDNLEKAYGRLVSRIIRKEDESFYEAQSFSQHRLSIRTGFHHNYYDPFYDAHTMSGETDCAYVALFAEIEPSDMSAEELVREAMEQKG